MIGGNKLCRVTPHILAWNAQIGSLLRIEGLALEWLIKAWASKCLASKLVQENIPQQKIVS